MIQNLSAIRRRIKSVENTRKITRAMEMVSYAKLGRVKSLLFSSKLYFEKLESLLHDFLKNTGYTGHPMIRTHHASSSAIALCVIASDTGLCSAYNQNVFRAAVEFLTDFDKDDVRIVAVGKEALRYFQNRGYLITDKFIETRGIYTDELSDKIQKSLCSIFENETLKGVYVAHAHFGTMLRQRYKVEKFLNIDVPAMAGDKYILEPSREAIGRSLIDRYLTEKMRLIILDAFTSEHSARMVAMKTATDNADDMLLDLTLSRNKARQAAITKEVLEVSSVREAMRG